MKALFLLISLSMSFLVYADGPNFDRHQDFLVSPDLPASECAKKTVEAAIQASRYPQIQVYDFRESSTMRTFLNSARGDRYFEFSGTDGNSHKFTGFTYVQVAKTYTEEPLSGKRTPVLFCRIPFSFLNWNLIIKNIRGTAIIAD